MRIPLRRKPDSGTIATGSAVSLAARAARAATARVASPKLKGSIGEGPNQTNY